MAELPLSHALAEAAKWGNLIRALSSVQDVLKAAEALEQNRAERQKAVDELAALIEAGKAQLALVTAEIAAATAQVAAHQAEGERLVQLAINAARNEAADILTAARAEAEAARTQADAARAELEQAQSPLPAARAELAALLERIDAAKADARARFGDA